MEGAPEGDVAGMFKSETQDTEKCTTGAKGEQFTLHGSCYCLAYAANRINGD